MRLEIRNNSIVIDGYVNAVERDSRTLPSKRGKFVERIKAGTWSKALLNSYNVDLLFNHIESRKLGSTIEKTLELYEDNIGLRAICTVSDPEVVQKAKDNKLTGFSFKFASLNDSWEDAGDGLERRSIEDLKLFEVSILDITPAYYGTSIEARGEEMDVLEYRSQILDIKTLDQNVITEKNEELRALELNKKKMAIELELL